MIVWIAETRDERLWTDMDGLIQEFLNSFANGLGFGLGNGIANAIIGTITSLF
jgi:hypothetical protein